MIELFKLLINYMKNKRFKPLSDTALVMLNGFVLAISLIIVLLFVVGYVSSLLGHTGEYFVLALPIYFVGITYLIPFISSDEFEKWALRKRTARAEHERT